MKWRTQRGGWAVPVPGVASEVPASGSAVGCMGTHWALASGVRFVMSEEVARDSVAVQEEGRLAARRVVVQAVCLLAVVLVEGAYLVYLVGFARLADVERVMLLVGHAGFLAAGAAILLVVRRSVGAGHRTATVVAYVVSLLTLVVVGLFLIFDVTIAVRQQAWGGVAFLLPHLLVLVVTLGTCAGLSRRLTPVRGAGGGAGGRGAGYVLPPQVRR